MKNLILLVSILTGTLFFSNIQAQNAPTDLAGTVLATFEVKLTWEDNSENEIAFLIERKANTPNSMWVMLASVDANVTEYIDRNFSTSVREYQYRVRAKGAHNTFSDYSNIITVTFTEEPPAAPTNLIATALSGRKVKLTWQDNSDNELFFIVERSSDQVFWVYAGSSGYQSEFIDNPQKPLTVGKTYYYRVAAANYGGQSEYSNVASVVIIEGSGH